jgi:hypothetical protein
MRTSQVSLILSSLLLATSAAPAAILFRESVDYAAADGSKAQDLPGYDGNTGVIFYEDTGLGYPDLTGAAGGQLLYDFSTNTGNRSVDRAASVDFSFLNPGDQVYLFALGRVDAAIQGAGAELILDPASNKQVNRFAFGFDADNAYFRAQDSGADVVRIGDTPYSVGETVGFLIRATRGTGTSPVNSSLEFWINPDLSNLGAADTSMLSKALRPGASEAIEEMVFFAEVTGTVGFDEIIVATELEDFAATAVIPEPSTVVLMGVGVLALGVILRRRLR